MKKLILALILLILQIMNLHVVFEGDSRTYQDSWTDIVVDTLQVEDSFVIATDGARWTTFESRAATLDAMLVDGKNNILFVWGGGERNQRRQECRTAPY